MSAPEGSGKQTRTRSLKTKQWMDVRLVVGGWSLVVGIEENRKRFSTNNPATGRRQPTAEREDSRQAQSEASSTFRNNAYEMRANQTLGIKTLR